MGAFAWGFAAVSTWAADPQGDCSPPENYSVIARRCAETLPDEHLTRQPLDDAISRAAWTNYLDALDPRHVCFLAADIARFRERRDRLDDDLKAGDLRFAFGVFSVYRERMTNRIAYAQRLLEAGFDLGVDEDYSVGGKAYANSEAVWDEVWRQKTKNEVVRYEVERRLHAAPAEPADSVRADLASHLAEIRATDAETVLTRYLTAFAQAYDAHSVYVPPSRLAASSHAADASNGGTTSWSLKSPARDDGVTNALGVIRLPSFYGNLERRPCRGGVYPSAARDVSRVLAHLRREGVDGVLLDLRGNPGGCQAETVAVTGLFIGDGPVVMTRRAGERSAEIHRDRDARVAYEGPLVVLVNRLSASASEVLAGTLQDYGRAVIVGDARTYGKGRCQTLRELGNDGELGALSISTLVNYRVSGMSAEGWGFRPDIVLPSVYEYCLDSTEGVMRAAEPGVSAAGFSPVAALSSVIPRLRERSSRRRALDARHTLHDLRLARVADLVCRQALPLHVGKRLELVQACGDELRSLRRLFEGGGTAASSVPLDGELDLALEEALAILADWVEMRENGDQVPLP